MPLKFPLAVAASFLLCTAAHAQKSQKDYFDALKAAGFERYTAVPFSTVKVGFAVTELLRSSADKLGEAFHAVVSTSAEGTRLVFKRIGPCSVGVGFDKPVVRPIVVNGKTLDASAKCYRATDGGQEEVYAPQSADSRTFVHNEFRTKPFVFVQLDRQVSIPFKTDGFDDALKSGGLSLY